MKIVQFSLFPLIIVLLPNSIVQGQVKNKTPSARETVVLQRVAVPGTDREMGMGIADFPPNSSKPRQKALGPETCYVLKGQVTVEVEGQQTGFFMWERASNSQQWLCIKRPLALKEPEFWRTAFILLANNSISQYHDRDYQACTRAVRLTSA